MKEYVSKLEKELASTRAQLQAQNDMQKAMGGALVAILEKTFGKVPEQFVTLLTKHLNHAKMNSVSVYGITCRNSNLIAQGFSTYGRALQAIDLH
nr:uncharacterized protein LOC109149981 [Ipomoea trifida]